MLSRLNPLFYKIEKLPIYFKIFFKALNIHSKKKLLTKVQAFEKHINCEFKQFQDTTLSVPWYSKSKSNRVFYLWHKM